MSCNDVEARLDDYVDGALSGPVKRDVDDHLAGCAECRRAEAGLRSVVTRAASMARSLDPGRDLWPRIAARISGDTVVRRAFRAPRAQGWPRFAALAAAAAVLVAISSVVTMAVLSRRGATTPTSDAGRGTTFASLRLEQAHGTYEAARTQLLAALASRRGSLSPATLKVVDDNLAIIDRAVREMEAALARDPGNEQLPVLLVTAYQQEIDMLERVTQAPVRG